MNEKTILPQQVTPVTRIYFKLQHILNAEDSKGPIPPYYQFSNPSVGFYRGSKRLRTN